MARVLVPRSLWDPIARILSQVITALVNVTATATAAHSLTVSRFGLFAVGWGILQAAIYYVRVVLVPLVILDDRKPKLAPLIASSLPVSLLTAAFIAVGGIWVTGDVPISILLGAATVAILAFEVARGALVGYLSAGARPRALFVDGVYALVALSLTLAFVTLSPWRSVVCLLAALPVASLASGLLAVRMQHAVAEPQHAGIGEWLRRSRGNLGFGVAEWAAFALSAQVAIAVLAFTASPVLVAGIRGGQALLFPFLLIGASTPTIVAPMLADHAGGRVPRSTWLPPLVVFGSVVGVWVALTVANPYDWVRLLLADTSTGALEAFPYLVVGVVFGVAASILSVYLKSLGQTARVAVARWANVATEPVLVVLGGQFGLTGAAIGMAVGQALGFFILLGMAWPTLRRESPESREVVVGLGAKSGRA